MTLTEGLHQVAGPTEEGERSLQEHLLGHPRRAVGPVGLRIRRHHHIQRRRRTLRHRTAVVTSISHTAIKHCTTTYA